MTLSESPGASLAQQAQAAGDMHTGMEVVHSYWRPQQWAAQRGCLHVMNCCWQTALPVHYPEVAAVAAAAAAAAAAEEWCMPAEGVVAWLDWCTGTAVVDASKQAFAAAPVQ